MDRQMANATSKQEDGTKSNSTTMVVHGVTDHPTQESAKRVRLQRASERVDSCCTCTRFSTYKMNLCEWWQARRPCRLVTSREYYREKALVAVG